MNELQTLNLGINLYNSSVQTLATMMDILLKSMEMHKTDPVAKELGKLLKEQRITGNDLLTMHPTDSLYEATKIQDALRKNGVQYAQAVEVDGKAYTLIPSVDIERASQVIGDFYHDHELGGECTAREMQLYSQQLGVEGGTKIIEGLTASQQQYFSQLCKENNIPIYTEGPEDSQYSCRIASHDEAKVEHIKAETFAAFSGAYGKILNSQQEWKDQYQLDISEAILKGKTKDGEKIGVGSRIIGQDGSSIVLEAKGVHFVSENGRKTYPRASLSDMTSYEKEVQRFLTKMKNPVLLTRDENRTFARKPVTEKFTYLVEKERSSGRPTLSDADLHSIAEHRVAVESLTATTSDGTLVSLEPDWTSESRVQEVFDLTPAELKTVQEYYEEINRDEFKQSEEFRVKQSELDENMDEHPITKPETEIEQCIYQAACFDRDVEPDAHGFKEREQEQDYNDIARDDNSFWDRHENQPLDEERDWNG